jgi:hypothetical protein
MIDEKISDEKRTVAKLLRELADTIGSLNDDEFAQCARGELHVRLAKSGSRPKGKFKAIPDQHAASVQQIAARLQVLPDRESVRQLLRETCKTKSCLEQLARVLDLPVRREDTVESLSEKVVEATIGFRLRSEAIRGKLSNVS